MNARSDTPVGTQALILSKLYYGVLSKSLENLDIERYFSVLYFVNRHNGCSQQFICNHLSIDKTAMVKVINYLVKAGYISRTRNPEDRREYFISLTKKGEKRSEEISSAFSSIDAEMFAGMTREKKEQFLDMLTLLSDRLRALPSEDLFFNYKKTKPRTGKK